MNSSRPLTALADAQAMLLAMLAPVAPCDVACADAVGLVAADLAPLKAPSPALAIALRAGYALRAQELAGASSFSPAFLTAAPQPVRIGDALPEGCDCVLDAAALDLEGPTPQAFAEAYPGENVRRAGEDFPAGSIVVPAGRRIRARDALAASRAGVANLPIRQSRVLLSGDAALTAFIASLAQGDGAEVASDAPDLVIAIGEAPASATWRAQAIALEPGRDCAVGRVGETPAVFLPRTPDQAFAGYIALVRPALDRLAARVRPAPRAWPLTAKISSRVGVAELALLRAQDGRFTPLCVGECPLQSLTLATHVTLIAAGSEGFGAGEVCAADSLDA